MSDFQSPSEDELLLQLALAQQGGADPYSSYVDTVDPFYAQNKKIDYLNKIANMTGIPFVQLAGVGGEQAAAPQVPQTRQMYQGNAAFQKAFDAIDAGYDPYSVTAAYVQDSKADPTLAGIDPKEFRSIAEQYAKERVATPEQGGFSKADGSKYKYSPLGGNDIYATASEYDLMGAPSMDEALRLVAQSRRQSQGGSASLPFTTREVDTPAGEYAQGFTPGRKAAGATFEKVPAGKKTVVNPLPDFIRPVLGGKRAPVSAGDRQVDESFDNIAKWRTEQRLNKAAGTQVRSDANTNAMRRIVALRSLLSA